jgi:hypothetical protein
MNNLSRGFAQFLVGIVVIAGIFLMVRPNSQGPGIVSSVGTALSNLVSAGTGSGNWGTPASGTSTSGTG